MSTNFLKTLDDYFEESTKRWHKVDELCEDIKKISETSSEEYKKIAELLFMIVEHLKPAKDVKSQLKEIDKDISKLFSGLVKK